MLNWKYQPSVFTLLLLAVCGCVSSPDKEEEHATENIYEERAELQKAMEQEFLMTRDPVLGYIPKERLEVASRYRNSLIASQRFRTAAITWAERGPVNPSGRTRAFFIDRRDATGNTIFSASVSGGIWKATNFKSTPVWTPVAENMGSIAVCALEQDPSNPAVMYAGTGEGYFNVDAVRGNGIWKSTNGGTTWTHLPSTDSSAANRTHRFDYVQDIVVNSNGTVFATGRPSRFCNVGGVYRSADGGATWTQAIGTLTDQSSCDSAYNYFGSDLELASNGDIYATTGFLNSGEIAKKGRIFRSSASANGTNVGAAGTWVDITPPGIWQRIDMAVSPSNPAVLYALFTNADEEVGSIKKSMNSGATWTDLPLPTWCDQGRTATDFTRGQAIYDLIIQVDPLNPNTVMMGGIDLFKSTNGGLTWNQISQWATNCNNLPVIHADQHNIKFLPGSSSEVYVTNDGGIYYSNNGGVNWALFTVPNINGVSLTTYSAKNIGYNITQLYACDVHPTQTNYFLIGMQDNGSHKLTSSGLSTSVETSLGGDGGYCHIDQTNGQIQILSYVYNDYYYSRNGGNSFTRISFNESGFFINPSDFDDVSKILYTSSESGKLGSVRGFAGTSTPTFNNISISALGNRKVSAVKLDPTVASGGTVWIAGADTTSPASLQPVIIKVINANVAPTATVNTTLTTVPAGSIISSIDVDGSNANRILITLSNYGVTSVYESTNGGVTFNPIEGNLPDVPVRWGMFVPANASVTGTTPGGILLATEIGVWFSQLSAGAATTWIPQSAGLPNVRVDMLRYRASDNLLAAATHGRGLFTTNLTSITTGVPTVPDTRNFIDYVSADRQQLFIKTGNLAVTSMDIRLFDAGGRLVYSGKTGYANQTIPLGKLASGSYVLKVYGNRNEQFTRQFIK